MEPSKDIDDVLGETDKICLWYWMLKNFKIVPTMCSSVIVERCDFFRCYHNDYTGYFLKLEYTIKHYTRDDEQKSETFLIVYGMDDEPFIERV